MHSTPHPLVTMLFVVAATPIGGCGSPAGPDDAEDVALSLRAQDPCDGAAGAGDLAWHDVRAVAEVDALVPPRLHLALGLDDAAIARRFPFYDGASERVFACVPLREGPYGTGPRYRQVDLHWQESVSQGGRTVDVHRTSLIVHDDFDTPTWSWNRGVYFGIETHGRLLWAQWPGHDLPVHPLGYGPPTATPLP